MWRPHIAERDEGLRTEVKGVIVPGRAIKAYGGAEVQLHSFTTSALHAGRGTR